MGLAYAALGSLRQLAAAFGLGLSTFWRWKQAGWAGNGTAWRARHLTPACGGGICAPLPTPL